MAVPLISGELRGRVVRSIDGVQGVGQISTFPRIPSGDESPLSFHESGPLAMPKARRTHRSSLDVIGAFVGVLLSAAAGVSAASPLPLSAQIATVDVEENFRAEPNGTILAEIQPGTVLGMEGRDGSWVRATLEGWIWRASVEAVDHPAFDLRVSAEGGENLRVEPQETVLARMNEGMLLEEVEGDDDWIRVRRSAWIWAPSVEIDEPEDPEDVEETSPSVPEAGAEGEWTTLDSSGIAVLAAPDGSDTLAVTPGGTDVRVLGRRGGWARVRLEGWVWMPVEVEEEDAQERSTVLTDATPADVAEDPESFQGRLVSWELQFVSRETAESIRTDFYEGEPYLLTRYAGRSSSFVYVAVSPDRLEALGELTPLERIRVVGRVRTAEAALTGGPVLDLVELERLER